MDVEAVFLSKFVQCMSLFLADFVAEIGIPTARDGWCIF